MMNLKAFNKMYYECCKTGNRSPELEEIILKSQNSSAFYYYARDVIKGRWKEAEDTITGIYMFCYAMNVIKGKLPDKMHNMMLLDAIENPNSLHVKSYFEFINK